ESEAIGYSLYNALQLRAEKRFSHGYTLNVAYTYSRAMDALTFLNPSDAKPWYGPSDNDRPHRVVVSSLYELPFGRGRRFGSNVPRALDAVMGGWKLNGVYAMQRGPAIAFGDVILRGNVSDVALSNPSVEQWFNTSLFERDPRKQLDANFQI